MLGTESRSETQSGLRFTGQIPMAPFELFCLYYLGLTPKGEYRFANANQVAGQYNWTVTQLMDHLEKHGLHPDIVLNTDFPLARHQVDIQLAAEKESPLELQNRANRIFLEFSASRGKRRNWIKEIEEEKRLDRERKRN